MGLRRPLHSSIKRSMSKGRATATRRIPSSKRASFSDIGTTPQLGSGNPTDEFESASGPPAGAGPRGEPPEIFGQDAVIRRSVCQHIQELQKTRLVGKRGERPRISNDNVGPPRSMMKPVLAVGKDHTDLFDKAVIVQYARTVRETNEQAGIELATVDPGGLELFPAATVHEMNRLAGKRAADRSR